MPVDPVLPVFFLSLPFLIRAIPFTVSAMLNSKTSRK